MYHWNLCDIVNISVLNGIHYIIRGAFKHNGFNFTPFFFSVDYVYGSGAVNTDPGKIKPYNRLDVAFLYKFNTKKIRLETGLSVINVLNTKNVRYNNFSNLPDNKTVYSESMPFTPTLFLNIGF